MSDPTLHDLMEDPTGWTDYSCECIVAMARDHIDELEARECGYQERIDKLTAKCNERFKRIKELEREKETWDGHKVCELLRKDVAELTAELETANEPGATDRIAKLEFANEALKADLEMSDRNARAIWSQVGRLADLVAEQKKVMLYVYYSSSVLTEPAEDMLMAALDIEEDD